jgi:hypothetical protein
MEAPQPMKDAGEAPGAFEPITLRRFYAAGNAFFLVDPARVHETFGEAVLGSDLLHSVTQQRASETAWTEGIAVPALGVEAGYYTVLVRSTATEGAMMPLTHIVYSTGFVLGTETGDLLLCNADRLAAWQPGQPPEPRFPLSSLERPVRVAPGWYAVTVVAGIREAGEDATEPANEEWVCAFLLDPRTERPAFTADAHRMLSFLGA